MELAIVGAGAAGAAAAYALRETPVETTVFEKSRGVCGRAATRRRGDCRYDHGANYLKSKSERINRLVTETLPSDDLVDIEEPVWVFDGDGEISPGREADEHKWTYRTGITGLAKRLFEETDAEIEFETRVGSLSQTEGRWRLRDVDDTPLGTFDAVLLTPPAPQTADLLAETTWAEKAELGAELQATVEAVPYRTIYTVVARYPFELDRPWYGIVDVEKEHPIGWVGREELKPGHVPDGSLLVIQMSPEYSTRRYDDPSEAVKADVTDRVAELLSDERLADPEWTDRQGWLYALPEDGADEATLRQAESEGLFFAGDWVVGDARLHRAVEVGLDTGERIADTS
ncbi:MAG: FAD-dependent oxidoreductase [Natronomonas sp.]